MDKKIKSVLLGVIAATFQVGATELQIHLAPESTDIEFTLKATMHTVHGTASLDRADFTIDTESGVASGEAVVAAASADTKKPKRDKKMHSSVLLSDSHPIIVFRAERVEGELMSEGTSEIDLVGVMEILGVEHPLTVALEVDMATRSATATFSVPYVEWGLNDPSAFMLRVGKEVPVAVTATNVFVGDISSRQNNTAAD